MGINFSLGLRILQRSAFDQNGGVWGLGWFLFFDKPGSPLELAWEQTGLYRDSTIA